MLSLAIGIGLTRGSSLRGPLAVLDLSTLTAGVSPSLPSALSFARSGTGTRTARTGQSTLAASGGVLSTAGANVAVAEWTASGVGLSLFGAGTNIVPTSRAWTGTGWTAGTGNTPTTGQTDPAGGTLATRQQVPVGGGSNFAPYNLLASQNGVLLAASLYARVGTGTSGELHTNLYNGSINGHAFTLAAAFDRFSASWTGGLTTLVSWADARTLGSIASAAQDVTADMFQVEAHPYATPYIPTAGASATRNGERLYLASAAPYVRNGRLTQRITFVAPCSSSSLPWDGYLAYYDASNSVRVTTGRQVAMKLNGATYTAPGLCNWLAGDVVTLEHGSGGGAQSFAMLTVNGYAFPLGLSGSAQHDWPTAGALDVMCSGTTGQLETSALQRVEFW